MKLLALSAFLVLMLGSGYADASEMVKVPAGEFVMGDNTDGYASLKKTAQLGTFFIDQFEVTNEEFRQ